MLIKCNALISQSTKEIISDSPWLKQGKIYTVLALTLTTRSGINVLIQSEDANDPSFFSLDGFEVLTQKQPKSWITTIEKIYDMDVITRLPKSWNYDSFFEDLDNQEPSAIEIFREEAIKIYDDEGYPEMVPKN